MPVDAENLATRRDLDKLRGNHWKGLFALVLLVALFGCDTDSPASSAKRIDATVVDTGADELQVSRLLGGSVAPGFSTARAGVPLVFPRDHGPHADYRSEWWYLTLMLAAKDGREFGGQFTLFRQASAPGPLVPDNPWRSTHLYMAHAALTDVAQAQHVHAERFARGHPQLAGVRLDPFRLSVDGWRLDSTTTKFLPLQLKVADQALQMDLTIAPGKPRVLQGERGFSAKGPGQGSFYYSYSRLQVSGSLAAGGFGEMIPVTGTAWLDREWSTSVLSPGQVGWDWFALQLADGRDLMVYRLRRADGQPDPFNRGLLVDRKGASRTLSNADFQLTPTSHWRDERSVCWPTGWRLRFAEELFNIKALVDDQRMDTAVTYWEGLVSVTTSPTQDAEDRSSESVGRGYMELTGYAEQAGACGNSEEE